MNEGQRSVDKAARALPGRNSAVLEYSNLAADRVRDKVESLLLPFAAGALLPSLVLALVLWEEWPVVLGFCVAWGETGALLVALKARRGCIRCGSKKRHWWTWVTAGAINSIAVAVIVLLTTRRDPFWPFLGQLGSILVAFGLTVVVSAVVATILIQRERR